MQMHHAMLFQNSMRMLYTLSFDAAHNPIFPPEVHMNINPSFVLCNPPSSTSYSCKSHPMSSILHI